MVFCCLSARNFSTLILSSMRVCKQVDGYFVGDPRAYTDVSHGQHMREVSICAIAILLITNQERVGLLECRIM
jgi:hypothetical protein